MDRAGDAALGSEITVCLTYRRDFGDLAPYFEGLAQGRPVASRCPRCGRRSFPPRILCPHDREICTWTEVSGTGTVVAVTQGVSRLPLHESPSHHCFALIRMDGCSNVAFGRVVTDHGPVGNGSRVRLSTAAGLPPHPAQAAVFTPV